MPMRLFGSIFSLVDFSEKLVMALILPLPIMREILNCTGIVLFKLGQISSVIFPSPYFFLLILDKD